MTKKQLQQLARTDNLVVRYSGKQKTAYMNFLGAIQTDFIVKYRGLFDSIGYELKSGTL